MKNNSRWMPAAVAALLVSLVTAMLEPSAFCNDAEAGKQTSETTPPSVDAPKPAIVLVAAARSAAQTVSQSRQPSAVSTTPLLPPSNPRPRQSQSNKKWIFIIAGAAAAGTITYFATRDGDPPPPPPAPTVTVGAPIVGQPQ